jgi:raffinose/stachyose/melibiose transport system permease protein
MRRDRRIIALFVGPGLLFYSFLVFVPAAWSVVYSLYDGSPGLRMRFNGVANFGKLFRDPLFLESLWKTLQYVSAMVGGEILLALLLALLFAFYVKRFSALVRTIVFLPVVLPIVAVGQLFGKIYDIAPYYGLINSVLHAVGLDSLVKPWIGIPSTALPALIVQDVWKGMGLYAVVLYAALTAIPRDVLESARLDGAGGLRLVVSILLPLLRPIVVTCAILSLSGTLKVYSSPLALTGGGPGRATYMLSMYMYDTAFRFGNYGYGSTIAVFILAECLLITVLMKGLFDRQRPTD